MWGEDKTPDLRDVVALICVLAMAGFFVQYFINGKEPSQWFFFGTGGFAIGATTAKIFNLLKPKTNGD